MGTKRQKPLYDVHCMDCGESYDTKFIPEVCTFRRCKSPNLFVEENSKYVTEGEGWTKKRDTAVHDGPDYPVNLIEFIY